MITKLASSIALRPLEWTDPGAIGSNRNGLRLLAFAATICVAFAPSPADAREVRLAVFQIGSAGADDLQQAKSDAYDQAVMALNNSCIGQLENVVKTSENCTLLNEQHTCFTTVRGTCVLHGR